MAENLRLECRSNAPLIGRAFSWTTVPVGGFMYLPERDTEAAIKLGKVNRVHLEKACVEWPVLLVRLIEFYAIRETCVLKLDCFIVYRLDFGGRWHL